VESSICICGRFSVLEACFHFWSWSRDLAASESEQVLASWHYGAIDSLDGPSTPVVESNGVEPRQHNCFAGNKRILLIVYLSRKDGVVKIAEDLLTRTELKPEHANVTNYMS